MSESDNVDVSKKMKIDLIGFDIYNFDQVATYLLPENLSYKTDLLEFNVDFFDIYDDFSEISKAKDDNIGVYGM